MIDCIHNQVLVATCRCDELLKEFVCKRARALAPFADGDHNMPQEQWPVEHVEEEVVVGGGLFHVGDLVQACRLRVH